jgi:F-type H+-transporting ATPase subunit beta
VYNVSYLNHFHVAEQFTGLKGVLVSIEDTIKGFNMILDGEVDKYPEAAFNLVGSIEEAMAKGRKNARRGKIIFKNQLTHLSCS